MNITIENCLEENLVKGSEKKQESNAQPTTCVKWR